MDLPSRADQLLLRRNDLPDVDKPDVPFERLVWCIAAISCVDAYNMQLSTTFLRELLRLAAEFIRVLVGTDKTIMAMNKLLDYTAATVPQLELYILLLLHKADTMPRRTEGSPPASLDRQILYETRVPSCMVRENRAYVSRIG